MKKIKLHSEVFSTYFVIVSAYLLRISYEVIYFCYSDIIIIKLIYFIISIYSINL